MKSNTYMAVYATFAETEAAVTLLKDGCFDMKRLSVAGVHHGTEQHVGGCYDVGGSLKYSGNFAILWTKLSKTLTGWGAFWSSNSGLVFVLGPLVQAIIAGQEEKSPPLGMNDFGVALLGIGIPLDSIVHYENALTNKKFLLLVDGAADEIERAHQSLMVTNPLNGTLHHGVGLLN